MSKDKQNLVLDLLSAATRIERRLDHGLSVMLGISFTEYQLLKALADSPAGRATRVDLANAVGLTPSAITRALRPLEKIGLVSTQRGERDARQNLALLTEAGAELLGNAGGIIRVIVSTLPLEKKHRPALTSVVTALGRD